MSICLVLMVRNEEAVIQRALDSAMSRCDAAFIVDTGSTDHTVAAAVEYLDAQRRPFRIAHETWRNFAVNRTQALRLAAQYYPEGHLLVLDADDQWEGNVSGLTADVYDVTKVSGSTEFAYPHIFSAAAVNDGRIRYRGVTHEFVAIDPSCRRAVLKSPRIVCGTGGARAPRKHLDDIALLTAAIERGDEPDLESRYTFYLAQAHRLNGDDATARHYYRRAVTLNGWNEEVFYSHLQLGRLGDDPTERLMHYLAAIETCPTRPEPRSELAEACRSQPVPMRQLGYWAASTACEMITNAPHGLFADLDVWNWRATFELSIAAFYVGRLTEGRLACEKILREGIAPEAFLMSTMMNLSGYPRL